MLHHIFPMASICYHAVTVTLPVNLRWRRADAQVVRVFVASSHNGSRTWRQDWFPTTASCCDYVVVWDSSMLADMLLLGLAAHAHKFELKRSVGLSHNNDESLRDFELSF